MAFFILSWTSCEYREMLRLGGLAEAAALEEDEFEMTSTYEG